MKTLLLIIASSFLFSCQKDDDNTPVQPINDNFDTSKATLIKTGMLEGVGHTVSGTVSLYNSNGSMVVILDPFSSQNGPDLRVYFSKDSGAKEYISFGKLKSTMGKQVYEVPVGTDINSHKYVHIWCEKFTVVFAIAEIK